MNETLVIGLGNTLRCDDGAGIVAAEMIGRANPGVDCLLLQELYPETADAVAEHRCVVFIDAAVDVSCLTVSELLPDDRGTPVGTHSLTPAKLLVLSRDLSGCVPQSILIRIPASRFDFGEMLTPPTAAAVEQCVAQFNQITALSTPDNRSTN
jgi:hydrogenase maturation protease